MNSSATNPAPSGTELSADWLRARYLELLAVSQARPVEERAVAYDPRRCDAEETVGPFRRRLDPRRRQKQKKGTPDDSSIVRPSDETIVIPALTPERFNFTKVRPEERLLELELAGAQYQVIANKYPLCPFHLLLVSEELRPQILTKQDLEALQEFLIRSGFSGFFNSWSAAATVNHLHFQLLDAPVPLTQFPLEPSGRPPRLEVPGYPARHWAFPAEAVHLLWEDVRSLQEANQPHNLFATPEMIYLFPRSPDPNARGQDLYGGEEIGGLECAGVFTAYERSVYENLTGTTIEEMLRQVTRKAESGIRY